MKITEAEKKLINWANAHLLFLFFIFLTISGVFLRYFMRAVVSSDASCCLLPWYDEIKNAGGLSALKKQVGNYNMLYQILISIMTYLPIEPLYAYKILSGIFDYALAAAVGIIIYDAVSEHKKELALAGYAAVLFSPIVLLNSAAWAQCDSIYCFFILFAFYFLMKERYGLTFIFLGLAFAFKLQAIFALPFFALAWFIKKKFSLLNFLLIPAVMLLPAIPAALMGRKHAFLSVFTIYADQASLYEALYMNYPSFWAIFFSGEDQGYGYTCFKNAAIGLAIVLMIALAVVWVRKKASLSTPPSGLYLLFLLTYTCVLFMPAMHERYGYLYEILAILIAILNKKTRPLLFPLYTITLLTYGNYLFGGSINFSILGIANCAVYLGYLFVLMPALCKQSQPVPAVSVQDAS